MFVPVSRSELQSEIQKIIETGCSGLNKGQLFTQVPSDLPQGVPVDDMFGMEKNFESLLTTLDLFIEQEPISNVPMNLDVNFWHVRQDTFFEVKGSSISMRDAIFKENDDSFQNSHIYLVFYEKIKNTDLPEETVPAVARPELISMSQCKMKRLAGLDVPELAYKQELLLVLQGVTAQFVTNEKYQQLLFILGRKDNSSVENQQISYKDVLTVFNNFITTTPEIFIALIKALQFPFVYDHSKSLA